MPVVEDSLWAFSLSRHPRPPVETRHPHTGRHGAPGPGLESQQSPSPRPDDSLICRYASVSWYGQHRLSVPFDDSLLQLVLSLRPERLD